jgi:hypothetical protein
MVNDKKSVGSSFGDADEQSGPFGFDANEALTTVTEAAKQHPHVALAGAFVVGFLLGGGLTPRLLGAAALFAARRYFRQTVQETIESVQQNIAQNLSDQFGHKPL